MSTLHFRCSFDLTSKTSARSFEILQKTVRKWVGERPRPAENDDFWKKPWFYQGGLWKSQTHPGIRVVTRACDGNSGIENSRCWATEYEHPCDEFPNCRFWRVHIGIEEVGSNQFHFAFQTHYDARPGYLGPEPNDPLPSAPRLIQTFLRSNFWRCTAGNEELSTSARVLRVGEGHLFARLIENSGRTCPVILVSQTYPDQGWAINPSKLARLVAGTAIVVKAESSEVDRELEYVLGRRFSCWNGMVRIYVPGLSLDRQGDERRHRFILKSEVDSWGPDTTVENIVRCVARRSTRPRSILTPLDVEAVTRQRRLMQLRAGQSRASKDEWIELLEKDNQKLNIDNGDLKENNGRLLERIGELEDEVRRAKHESEALKVNLTRSAGTTRVLASDAVIKRLEQLPKTVADVTRLIEAIHPERIAFTERAMKSADESTFRDIHRAWKAFWGMATVLYDLLCEQRGNDVEKRFKNQTGFELALTEGKLTNKDVKLMSQRKDTFLGQAIDITPHVKLDADSTRAYFSAFSQNGTTRIVVGHIGHLPTAGTRKRGK